MKTAAVITVHVGQNFGSNLQTIATCEVLKKIGYNPLVVNYIPKRVARNNYWREAFKNPIKLCWRMIYAPLFYKNLRIYENYLSQHCALTQPIYDEDIFSQKCPVADVYITGSDQVWNSKHNQGFNKRYFWDGVSKAAKKIAYASSFGVESLPEDEYPIVKALLKSYHAISVRESSAKAIVESMGLNAEHVLDPIFMLDRDQWQAFMSPRLVEEPYLLMYVPYNIVDKTALYQLARTISKAKGLKVVTFSWDYGKEYLADITMRFANPGDFLSLMYHADYVITNSFHGTAFSINLNKQFSVYMPSGFGTRIVSILQLCNLEHRLVNEYSDQSFVEDVIDYNTVNSILDEQRKIVNQFLTEALA